jgi:hypothetical protein
LTRSEPFRSREEEKKEEREEGETHEFGRGLISSIFL